MDFDDIKRAFRGFGGRGNGRAQLVLVATDGGTMIATDSNDVMLSILKAAKRGYEKQEVINTKDNELLQAVSKNIESLEEAVNKAKFMESAMKRADDEYEQRKSGGEEYGRAVEEFDGVKAGEVAELAPEVQAELNKIFPSGAGPKIN